MISKEKNKIMDAKQMLKKTLFCINTEKYAKEALDILMEQIHNAACLGRFEIESTQLIPPKTILTLTKLMYDIKYTEEGTTIISWNKFLK